MPNSILDLYTQWKRVENGAKVPIQSPGKFDIGTENTAANQAVNFLSTKESLIGTDVIPGFTTKAKKHTTEYPIKNEPVMEIVRIMETNGTHNVPRLSNSNKYSDITPRV